MKHQIEFRRVLKLVLALAVATLLSPALYGQARDKKIRRRTTSLGRIPPQSA